MHAAENETTARAIYDTLTADERRARFVLSPTYRIAYNRILDNEDRMTLPRYFWRKWLPLLGAESAALYVVLRDISRVEALGSDSWCWPNQEELGRRIGVSENTLRKRLGVLERYGFIRREHRRSKWREGWGTVQGTNHYEVYLDVPVTPSDGVELLLAEMERAGNSPERTFCALGEWPVENALGSNAAPRAPDRKSCAQGIEEDQAVTVPDLKSCGPNVRNVINETNVRDQSPRAPLRDNPLVRAMSAHERRKRAALADEIGETLSRLSGDRNQGQHRSYGLHRRIAFLMPEDLVRGALRTSRDAVDDHHAGRKTLEGGPSGYFAGIAFALADEHGIDLGVRRRALAPTNDRMGPGPRDPGKPRDGDGPRCEEASRMSDEELAKAREALEKLRRTLESRTASHPHDAALKT